MMEFKSLNDKNLVSRVFKKLKDNKITIALAESMTGGMISSILVGHEGASEVLKGSVVCYTLEVKHNVLNVSEKTLNTYSAVSKETLKEMLDGIESLIKPQISLALTGYADGPIDKGTGFIGVKFNNDYTIKAFSFQNMTRNEVRYEASIFAFKLLLEVLK